MLRLARPLSAAARRQLVSRPLVSQIRGYAERHDTVLSSDPTFRPDVPQQGVMKAAVPVLPPQATPATPTSTTTIPPANIPREPPPPPSAPVTPSTAGSNTSSPPPPPPLPSSPPPSPKPKRFRTLRRLLYLAILSAIGYGGAVAWALRNDNFHDFFTEYVPFGEDSVLYFEERAFHKKFPNAKANVYRTPVQKREDDKKVTIPQRSGLSWKAVDETKETDVSQKGAHMSAVNDKSTKDETKQQPADASLKAKSAAVESVKDKAPSKSSTTGASSSQPKKETRAKAAPVPSSPATPSPKSDPRPPAIAPVAAISPVTVEGGDEPVVHELVKIINDLITVVNADSENANRYSAPMQKAKDAMLTTVSKVAAMKDAERAAAEERIKEAHKEFDEGAKKLLERIETAQREDDVKYREEFEAEREKIAQQYENRLKAEVDRTQQVWQQKLQNEVSEQGLKMKQKFIEDIQGLVESEREGRLSKLTNMSSNVDNLTQLASNWNGVIEANLATQKLQVAVDAVRSALDDANATHKPTPFVREMAALKLVANSDPIVDAAVASINPSAYQKGIPSSAQLIDRFRRVASEVRKASLLPENAGIASHAASLVLSKVMFKKQGVPQGNDVESVLTRTETMLEEGDLDNAAREMNELKGWAGVLSKDWLQDARKVLEVKQALDVIETEARLQCLRVE